MTNNSEPSSTDRQERDLVEKHTPLPFTSSTPDEQNTSGIDDILNPNLETVMTHQSDVLNALRVELTAKQRITLEYAMEHGEVVSYKFQLFFGMLDARGLLIEKGRVYVCGEPFIVYEITDAGRAALQGVR